VIEPLEGLIAVLRFQIVAQAILTGEDPLHGKARNQPME
jgi:hypothetical protein